jgi:hypothetical protein
MRRPGPPPSRPRLGLSARPRTALRTPGNSRAPRPRVPQEGGAAAPYLCGDPRSTGIGWLVECHLPSWWRGRAEPESGSRWSARSNARTNDRGAGNGAAHPWPAREGGPRSAHPAHPLATTVVVTGLCVRAPSLIWVRGPSRVRRQDDRWGVPPGARPRGLLRPSTDRPWRQGPCGRWPRHICLPVGRARTSHLGQAASGRSSTGASAASPSASRVWRTRRTSLRATAKVARLPPWRALTCW